MITLETPAGKATYQLVGSAEADPDENRLSNESPIGRASSGSKKGEKVDVDHARRPDQGQDRRDRGRVAGVT